MANQPLGIRLTVPIQGINLELSADETKKFFAEEMSFYERLQKITDTSFVFVNQNYGEARLARNAIEALRRIRDDLVSGKDTLFLEYQKNAQQMRHLIGQGAVGRKVDELLAAGQPFEAKWIAYLSSPIWLDMNHDRAADIVTAFRASLTANPALIAVTDLFAADQAVQAAESAVTQSKNIAAAIDAFRTEKVELFSDLEKLYRQKLVLDEPAVLWEKIAVAKAKTWRAWLIVFAILIAAPIIFGIFYRFSIIETLMRLTTNSSGGISISGIAAITVPTLFYAWLLKNVSRVFIQNLNLADDAAHRRALALTYLGLAANPNLDVSENDRALILNALFRPIPPQTVDEGPPSGLLELIRKKD